MRWIPGNSPIAFPGLGLTLNPPKGFAIGSLEFAFYGIIIALGLVLTAWYGLRRKKDFGLNEDQIIDGVLIILPIAVICARLYYCIFSWSEYKHNPIEILYIWNGGLAIYGAVIGAAVSIIVYCKVRKLSLPAVFDITALGFLIGQAVGRWGNFFNREAYGSQTGNFLRMGLELTENGHSSSQMFFYHPTFLYESLWNLAGFIGLHFLSKRRQYDGQIALGYVAWYGLGRALIEGLRTDSLYWGPIRVSQLLAAISCAAAVGVLIWQAFKPHKEADLFCNRVAAAEEAAEAAEEEAEDN